MSESAPIEEEHSYSSEEEPEQEEQEQKGDVFMTEPSPRPRINLGILMKNVSKSTANTEATWIQRIRQLMQQREDDSKRLQEQKESIEELSRLYAETSQKAESMSLKQQELIQQKEESERHSLELKHALDHAGQEEIVWPPEYPERVRELFTSDQTPEHTEDLLTMVYVINLLRSGGLGKVTQVTPKIEEESAPIKIRGHAEARGPVKSEVGARKTGERRATKFEQSAKQRGKQTLVLKARGILVSDPNLRNKMQLLCPYENKTYPQRCLEQATAIQRGVNFYISNNEGPIASDSTKWVSEFLKDAKAKESLPS